MYRVSGLMVELLVFLSNWAYFIMKCCLFCSGCKSFSKYTWVPAFVNYDTSRLQYYNPKAKLTSVTWMITFDLSEIECAFKSRLGSSLNFEDQQWEWCGNSEFSSSDWNQMELILSEWQLVCSILSKLYQTAIFFFTCVEEDNDNTLKPRMDFLFHNSDCYISIIWWHYWLCLFPLFRIT